MKLFIAGGACVMGLIGGLVAPAHAELTTPTVTATVSPSEVVFHSTQPLPYTVTAVVNRPVLSAFSAYLRSTGSDNDFLVFDNPSGDNVTWVATGTVYPWETRGVWTLSDVSAFVLDEAMVKAFVLTAPATLTVSSPPPLAPVSVTATIAPRELVFINAQPLQYTVTAVMNRPVESSSAYMRSTGDSYDFMIFNNPSGDKVTWVATSTVYWFQTRGVWTLSDVSGLALVAEDQAGLSNTSFALTAAATLTVSSPPPPPPVVVTPPPPVVVPPPPVVVTPPPAVPTPAPVAAALPAPVVTFAAPPWVIRGQAGLITGSVYTVSADRKVPLAATRLLLQKRTGRTWSSLRYMTTSASGTVLMYVRPLEDTGYRWLFPGSAKLAAAPSKQSVVLSLLMVKYANCAALNAKYPHGVARTRLVRDRAPAPVDPSGFYVAAPLYDLNAGLDRDKDGIACEKA